MAMKNFAEPLATQTGVTPFKRWNKRSKYEICRKWCL